MCFRLLLFFLLCCSVAHAYEVRSVIPTIDSQGRAVLDLPSLNAQPSRILIVTALLPEEVTPAADYGVFYDLSQQRWLVIPVDGSRIQPGTRFHLAILDPDQAIRHVVESDSLAEVSGTYLPFTNQQNILLVTPDLSGSTNPSPVAVSFDTGQGRWKLVNRNGSPMPVGSRFNLYNVNEGQIVPSTDTIQSDSGYFPFTTARWAPGYLVGQAGLRVRSLDERSQYRVATSAAQPATAGEYYNLVILQQCFEGPAVARPANPPAAPTASPAGVRVRVLTENNQPAAQVEVWLNDQRLGNTNNAGELRLPGSARAADMVLARQVTRTVDSYRHRGPAFRVWKTSFDGAYGNRLAGDVRVGSAPVRVLRLNRAMIGVSLHSSIEWDCTTQDLGRFQDQWSKANDYLYDATDGQFFLEQVALYDDGQQWDNCDIRHWTNANGRASCLPRVYGLVNPHPWSYVNLPRFCSTNTWIHEFGHYGLCLLDEYHETPGHPAGCTLTGQTEGSSAFHSEKPKAACIMCHHDVTHKICSGFSQNSHRLGTRQGVNCWTQIRDCFPYGLKGPAERGFVPGTCLPPRAWKPSFEAHNRDRGRPLAMLTRTITDSSGSGVSGVPVWLESGGRSIFQGFSCLPDPERGWVRGDISLDGLHLGDRLTIGNWGQTVTVTESFLAARGPLLASTNLDGLAQVPPDNIRLESESRSVPMWLRADGTVQGTGDFSAEVCAAGDDKPQPASRGVPINRPSVVKVELGDHVYYSQAALFQTESAPTVEGQAASNDGLLMLEFPSDWIGRIAVSSGGEATTSPPGLLAGPYQVDWSGPKVSQPLLKFRLLDVERPPNATVHRYDPASGSWTDMGGNFIQYIGYMQLSIQSPGCYALIRPGAEKLPQGPSQVEITSVDSQQIHGFALGSPGDVVLLELFNSGGDKVYEATALPLNSNREQFFWPTPTLAAGSYRARLRKVNSAGNTLLSPWSSLEIPAIEQPSAQWLRITAVEAQSNQQFLLRTSFALNRSTGLVFTVSDGQGNPLRHSQAFRCGPGEASVQWLIDDLQPNSAYVVTAATEDGVLVSPPFPFVTPAYKDKGLP